MAVKEFRDKVMRLKNALESAASRNIDVESEEATPASASKKIFDFKAGQKDYHKTSVMTAMDAVMDYSLRLNELSCHDDGNAVFVAKIRELVNGLQKAEDKTKGQACN